MTDALVYAHEDQSTVAVLTIDAGCNQRADARGIDGGDMGEIEDQRARVVGADHLLEPSHCVGTEWAFKAKNELARLGAGLRLNVQGVFRHDEILSLVLSRGGHEIRLGVTSKIVPQLLPRSGR